MTGDYTHKGSKRNLLGENPDSQLTKKMSSELQVNANTPPTFLILSDEDKVVPAENSVAFYLALRDAGVPAEMHIFEKGKTRFWSGPVECHSFGLDGPVPAMDVAARLSRNLWPINLVRIVGNQINIDKK